MSKIIVVILFALIVFTTGLEQDQESDSEPDVGDKSESREDKDKYEVESRQDYDKTSEKEKELKLLRKSKRLKETNYRRALENILPAKNSAGYRRFFEELINRSGEKTRSDASQKAVEEVVVTDTFVDGDGNDRLGDSDPEVEEIEVVIEHITDGADNETLNEERVPESQDSSLDDVGKIDLKEKSGRGIESRINNEQQTANLNPNNDAEGRSGHDSSISGEMDTLHLARPEERRLLEPFPLSRISEMVIPHYRTTLTRSGVMVSPAVYTVQTSAPIIDHVTTRNWMPSRGISPDIFVRSGSNRIGRSDFDKFIDDYNDYGSNAYSYAPSKTQAPSRQVESKMDILSKLAEVSLQPQPMGNMKSYRENVYPGTYYSQPQAARYLPESYRPLFRLHR